MFKMNSGVLDSTPSSKAPVSSAYPGAFFTVSSDGAQNGVAWAVRTDQYTTHGPQVLYAFDANDLSNILYESDTNVARDGGGHSMKFAIPVVTNGKVYVAALGEVDVYGLFNGSPTAVAPTITPDGGTFGGTLSVSLSSATASANVFYTLDGSVPTPASPLYSGPIAISTDTTIRAIASAEGFIQSAVSSATFQLCGADACSDIYAWRGDLHISANGYPLGHRCQGGYLLHDRRHHPDRLLQPVYSPDRSHGFDDDQGCRDRWHPCKQ